MSTCAAKAWALGALTTYDVMLPPSPPPPPTPPSPPPPSLTFSTIATTGPRQFNNCYMYSGAAAVGNKVVFAPVDANNVGVLDTYTGNFITVATTGTSSSGENKYAGAAAVANKVYFTPDSQCNVGVFDTTNNIFTTVVTSYGNSYAGCGNYEREYAGAVALGDIVYFAPYAKNDVGVFNTTSNVFSTIALTGAASSHIGRYSGAVAVGNKVYFAPHMQDNVGVLDTTTNVFSTVATTGDAYNSAPSTDSGSSMEATGRRLTSHDGPITQKYGGAAAVGTLVVFAPYNQNNVGLFDTTSDTFTTVATTGDAASGDAKYGGAVTVGTKVYFSPRDGESSSKTTLGIFDTATNVFNTIAVERGSYPMNSATLRYDGAAVVGTKVYFAPSSEDNVGVLQS